MAECLRRKVRKRTSSHQKDINVVKRWKQDDCQKTTTNDIQCRITNDTDEISHKLPPGDSKVSFSTPTKKIVSTPVKSPKLIQQIQYKKPLFKSQGHPEINDTEVLPHPEYADISNHKDDILLGLVTSTPSDSRSKQKEYIDCPVESPVTSQESCMEKKTYHRDTDLIDDVEEWGCDDSSFFAQVDVSNIVSQAHTAGIEHGENTGVQGSDDTDSDRPIDHTKCNSVDDIHSRIIESSTSNSAEQSTILKRTDKVSKNMEHPRVPAKNKCGNDCDRTFDIIDQIFFPTSNSPENVCVSNGNNSNNTKMSTCEVDVKICQKPSDSNITSTDSSSRHRTDKCNVTPRNTTSIKDRIKQRLQMNANANTPQQNKLQQLKEATITEALNNAKEMKEKVADKDVGPFYGLPRKVKDLLKTHKGIDQLYGWQHSCLTLPAILERKNLIYSLPTSGGKTLVAEILIMQQLLCQRKDALLILPFVSIVQEKVRTLSPFAVDLGFLVEEYAASKGAFPPRKRRKKKTLYIATIEKAHTLVNALIQESRIEEIGLIVVDELHMLGEGGRRGATLEMTLTKMIYLKTTQIIGMSATLNNISDLLEFLHAEIYTSDFRPVELTEYVKIGDNIFKIDPKALCPEEKFIHDRIVTFPYKGAILKEDPDHLVGLVNEVIPNHSCLVFCPTKRNCQHVAEMLCRLSPKNFTEHKKKEKKELLTALRRECEDNLCSTLRRTIPFGIAYHHSGLTMDERKLIEDAYSDGTLCLLACTSTLAAGVNLPAKRVILRSPYIATQLLTGSKYKQMVGRAGRAGIDTSGESILIIKNKDKQQVLDLLSSPLESCHSSLLYDDGKGIRSLVLSVIALQITKSHNQLVHFMKCTLCNVQSKDNEIDVGQQSLDAVTHLLKLGLIKEKRSEDDNAENTSLEVTKLGHAAFRGSLDIDVCPEVYNDLKTAAEKGLVVTNTLHLLYLVTPRDMNSKVKIDWMNFYKRFSGLSEVELGTAEMIGVHESYVARKAAGQRVKKGEANEKIVERFFMTLMLWYVLKQHSIWQVAAMFDVPRGFLQNLFSSSATFASSLQRFTEDLPEFWAFHHLLGQIVKELSYCSTADLIPLLEVPGVKQGRAKQLLKAGYKTLNQLAYTNPDDMVSKIEHMTKSLARQIVSAAKMELEERAEALRELAEDIVVNTNTNAP